MGKIYCPLCVHACWALGLKKSGGQLKAPLAPTSPHHCIYSCIVIQITIMVTIALFNTDVVGFLLSRWIQVLWGMYLQPAVTIIITHEFNK